MAQLLQRTDNALIKNMKIKKQIKLLVQDNFMFGTGIGKLGFGSQYHSTPETLGDTQAPLVKGNEALEYNLNIQPNMPWFLRSNPSTYVIEAGAPNKDSARWDCHIIRRPVEDVRVDPRLSNAKDIGPSSYQMDIIKQNPLNIKYAVDQIEMYEIRDRKTGKVFIITPGQREKTLLFEDDAFFSMGIDPTKAVVFNEDDENFWGVPDAQILEPNQLEINEIRTLRMFHRRLSVMKILAKRGSIKPEEVDKMLSPEVAAVSWVDGDIATAIKIITGESIPSDLTEAEMNVLQDVRESLGFSRNEFGEFKPGSKSPTATESNNVKVASEIRVDERRDMLADMLTEVVTDIHPIIFSHWSNEQVIDIVGPYGVKLWVAFTPTMLKRGLYTTSVDPDTSVPRTKDLRTQEAVQMYTILKENPLIDPVELTRYLLREMHGVDFDMMMRPLQGMGMTPNNPVPFGQASGMMQQMAAQAPQSLPQLTAQPPAAQGAK